MNVITKTVSLPDGRTITIETGKLAKQADGAVMLRMGNTMLLATVCAAKDAVPGTDFMPLQCDYRERYSAAGRFPGGFTKREGRPSDYEILTSRLVDRALRPLFPSNYHAEVYVNIMLFSADGVDIPDALAGFAASAALACSDIPFEGPISEVRVARIDGEYVIDPTYEQLKKADMDIMAATVNSKGDSQIVSITDDCLYCAMLDARRMEVYAAIYDASLKPVRETKADIVEVGTYASYLEKGKVCFFGNGASKCKSVITSPNAIFIEDIHPLAVNMIPLSEQAFAAGKFEDTAYFEPFYLKEFQATVAKNKVLLAR